MTGISGRPVQVSALRPLPSVTMLRLGLPPSMIWVIALLFSSLIHAVSLPDNVPTLAITALPSLLSLPPLNSSHPLLQLSFPNTASSLHITLNICSLGNNATVRPTVLLSTVPSASGVDLSERYITANRGSRDERVGGTREGGFNRRARASAGSNEEIWVMVWDKGFGNFTVPASQMEEGGVRMLLGLGLRTDGERDEVDPNGNVMLQLGVGNDGECLMYLHDTGEKLDWVQNRTP